MLNEDVESLCIFNRSRNSSVYTLSLLSLLELASHTDKLTLYTTMASHTDKHTVFNSPFFSLYNLNSRKLPYRINGKGALLILTYHVTLVIK